MKKPSKLDSIMEEIPHEINELWTETEVMDNDSPKYALRLDLIERLSRIYLNLKTAMK